MSGQIAGYAAPHELCALRPSLIGSASPRHRHRKLGAPREQLRGTWLKAWDADVTSRAQLERLPRRLNRDVVRVDFVVLVFGSSNTGESLPTRYRRMSLSMSRGSEGGRRSGPDHRDRYASNVALRVERVELDSGQIGRHARLNAAHQLPRPRPASRTYRKGHRWVELPSDRRFAAATPFCPAEHDERGRVKGRRGACE